MSHIWSWICLVFGGWIFDDSNYTDLPEATNDLVSGQSLYVLPTDAEHISGFEWQDANGNWTKLNPITLEEIREHNIAETEYQNTPGNPMEYRLIGNVVKLYPAANFDRTNGLKALFDRGMMEVDVDSTDFVPGFSSQFHMAIPTFNALQYAKIKGLKNAASLQKDWDGNEDVTGKEGGYKSAIKRFYNMRFKQMFPPKIRNTEDILSDFT